MELYHVVFEGTGGSNSNFNQIRTRTAFRSKDDFEEWKSCGNEDVIVAEGVSDEEADHLVRQTPGAARARAAFESVKREGGILEFELPMARMAAASDGKEEEFDRELLIIMQESLVRATDGLTEMLELLGEHAE